MGSHCTDCVAAAPKVPVKTRALVRSDGVPVTYGLIAANVVLFAVSALSDPQALISSKLTPLHRSLDLVGAAVASGDYYRLITSGFMHFGLIHLAFNMYLLYMLGKLIEPATGSIKFSLLYFASLLGGSFGAILLSPEVITAGASGAVFGLMGAAAVGQWLRGVNPFQTALGRLMVLNLVFTLLFSGQISVGGHLGGLIIGALCGLIVLNPNPVRNSGIVGYGVPIALMVGCALGAIATVAT